MTSTTRPSVYLVDDDESVLRSLRIVLRRVYDVTCFSSADTALQACVSRAPHVVVTDLKMPIHDGFWLLRELRDRGVGVPVIFNSAYQDVMSSEDVQGAMRPFGVLAKNGSLEAFLDMVSRALAVSYHPPAAGA